MFKGRFVRRKKRLANEAYLRGFQWAMGEIYVVKTPFALVQAKCAYSTDPFDKGANYALSIVEETLAQSSMTNKVQD